MRPMFRIMVILITCLVVRGEAVPAFVQEAAPRAQRHVVEIQAFSFQPRRTVVAPGDTVVWVNRDIVPHTITAEGGAWPTHTLEEGQSWEMAVNGGGAFPYFCEFHPHMKGLVATR